MIWVKVFKNGPSNICGRQPFVEGCLPQILLGPFSNTLNYIYVNIIYMKQLHSRMEWNPAYLILPFGTDDIK